MPAPRALSGLPKPLLFGLYGAVGGLLGAVLLGELVWSLLKPPPPPDPAPQVAVSASPSVQVYPKSENTFPVQIVRERFDTPVTVSFDGLPPGVAIVPVTIPKGATSAQATVTAAEGVMPREIAVALRAANEGGSVTATGEFKLSVVPTPPPPPALAVAVPPTLTAYKKGTATFPVSVARRGFKGPVTVTVESLPAGVTATPATVPEDKTEADVTLTVAEGAAAARTELTVSAKATGAPLSDSRTLQLGVQNPPPTPVDIVFALDISGSMQPVINGTRDGIQVFADELGKAQLDYRLGVATFRDNRDARQPNFNLKFGDKAELFTKDVAEFRKEVGRLTANAGGPGGESSLDGIADAVDFPFRPQGAVRVVIMITDEPPNIPDGRVKSMADITKRVKDANIDQLHLVTYEPLKRLFVPLWDGAKEGEKGRYFNLQDVARGADAFARLMPELSKSIATAIVARPVKAEVLPPPAPPKLGAAAASSPKAADAAPPPSIKSLQGGEQSAAGSEGKLILRSGAWAGVVAALICLVLLAGQHHYLRGSLPGVGGLLAGVVGGLVVGLAGGAAGQGLYLMAPGSEAVGTAFRVLGWTLLGGLAGAGLSFFIPNMKWFLGLAGGAIGGAVGAAGFIAVSAVAGDLVGRVVGGLLLGFCIGLMVAIVEAAFRRAWLEVRYGARETVTVTLGPEPVKVGGDARACTVWARGAAPLALRFFVRDGKVICDDATMRRESVAGDGFSKDVGNVTVTVRTGAGGGSAAPPAPPPPPAPASSRRAAVADDDFDLPMAVSPPPPARPAPAPPAPAPKPAAPTASKPALPAVPKPAPAAPTASKPAMPAVPPKPMPPKPVPPKPAAPTASKPTLPPVPPKPAAPAGPKNPNACPGCGRVAEGKPNARYCMVCDNTF